MGLMSDPEVTPVRIEPHGLEALLGVPHGAQALVIFAHGSGSGRLSPRNNQVASGLRRGGLATLLLDLLTPEEERIRANVFDIALLASRLVFAAHWAKARPELKHLGIGFFGASTGAGAALAAAAELGHGVGAVVSRGGRPDLAGGALAHVTAPTLLIVGGEDRQVIDLNRTAFDQMRCEKDLVIVPGAGHLFEEPGTLEQVTRHARDWFKAFLAARQAKHTADLPFADRIEAGRHLAHALLHLKDKKPIVLALPRGGVPVAFEIAQALDAPLDVALVRKVGAPGQPELGIGAVVDGANPQLVLNEDVMEIVRPSRSYVDAEAERQLAEIERRRGLYRHGRAPLSIQGRTVIVVDDGIATGGTMKAVLSALRQSKPEHLVLAVPVAPSDTIATLSDLADEVICLATPEPFHAVGMHYRDFTQTSDSEVVDLLARAPG
jgi:predicted phosphoribosyltransferase/dienelactone hydrolase